jgi:hypothetical protein
VNCVLYYKIPCYSGTLIYDSVYGRSVSTHGLFFNICLSTLCTYLLIVYSDLITFCVHRVLVGKTEGKSSLGRPRHRWDDNNKMDLQKVGGGGRGDWMELAQDINSWRALVGTVRNFRVP